MISTCCLGIWFVDMATVWALFVGVADGLDVKGPSLQVVVVALVSKECSATQGAARGGCRELAASQGSFRFDEIGAVLSFAGGAPFAVAGMMMEILCAVPSIAVVAEIGLTEKPFERIASVVVVTVLDES